MATAFVPASSEFVCDNIARRIVRNAGDQTAKQQVSAFINPFLKPIALRLVKSGRLQRGTLEQMVRMLVRNLRAEDTVFALEAEDFRSSKLSSNESYRIAYKLPTSGGEEWLGFTATEVNLTRRSTRIGYTNCDVFIHRHAISRFMQREAKPPEQIYRSLGHSINLATVLGWPIMLRDRDDTNIAVPLGDGMLFGRCSVFKGAAERGTFIIDKDRAEHEESSRTPGINYSLQCELMTYVDHASLTPSRHELRERICEFVDDNRWGIKFAADSSYFTRLVVPNELEEADVQSIIARLRPAAHELLNSPEWAQFIHTVGR